jgi:hypothetical protein
LPPVGEEPAPLLVPEPGSPLAALVELDPSGELPPQPESRDAVTASARRIPALAALADFFVRKR